MELLGESALRAGPAPARAARAAAGRAAPEEPERRSSGPARLFEVATRVLLGAAAQRAARADPRRRAPGRRDLAEPARLPRRASCATRRVLLVCTLQPPGRALASPLLRLLSDLSASRADALARARAAVARRGRAAGRRARTRRARAIRSPSASTSAARATRCSSRSSCACSRITRRATPATGDVALPPGLSATISLRLARLTKECRALARRGRGARPRLPQPPAAARERAPAARVPRSPPGSRRRAPRRGDELRRAAPRASASATA